MDQLTQNLRAAIGRDAVLSEPEELLVYECDGLTQHRLRPRAVIFPANTEEVSEVLRLLMLERVPFAPRGAGTGLSGGALSESVVIEMARMRRLLKLDADNRTATVEAGMVNAQLSRAAAPFNLHYVPDPSSQMTCTIGGNLAENAGGIHCLKYGMTVDHVMAARVVLAGGEIVDLFAGGASAPGYDLLGLFIGSEGTFGIATEATLRLTPIAPCVRTLLAEFAEVDDGSRAVSALIAAGLVPSALEMMDGATIRAVEQSVFAAGLPPDAGAALLIELDGLEAGLDDEAAEVESICRRHGARSIRLARDERERARFWAARKGAFGAMGRLAPDLMLQDTVVPRSRLPEVLAETYRIGTKYGLMVANVFHAGDGNLHPYICFDSRNAEEVRRVKEAGREMMETCVRAGGTITGEHGVGLDKSEYLPLIFSSDDMEAMLRVRTAFDPGGLCNPGKIIPTSRTCGEARAARPLNPKHDRTELNRTPGAVAPKITTTVEPAQLSSSSGRLSETTTKGIDEAGCSTAQSSSSPGRSHPSAAQWPTRQPLSSHSTAAAVSRLPFNADAARVALERIVGREHVAESLQPCAPSSVEGPAHRLTVAPASCEEACEILRLATHEGWSMVPAGAATWLGAGQPLLRADVVLQTTRMQRIIEHEPADLVASAEAGARLAQFNTELSRAGQWLPLDPPDDGRATLGGIAATGLGGAQSFGYGTPRNFVIGMRVALADGRIIKAGGRVVKNVAGYDLCKLLVGSYGTLGLILELTFKLRPRPQRQATVTAFGPISKLWPAARAVLDAQLLPVGLELISADTASAIGLEVEKAAPCALMIRFAGTAQSVAFQSERARSLLKHEHGINTGTVSPEDERLWSALAALPLKDAGQLCWRAQLMPGSLGLMLQDEQRMNGRLLPPGSLWQAGAGDGRLRVITSLAADTVSDRLRILEEERQRVGRLGGWMVVERAPRIIKEAFDVWGDMGPAGGLMRRVKQQLDSTDTFSPGRFKGI